MKKKSLFYLIIILLVVMTTGCGREVEVKNGSKVAVSTKDSKYTATEYYNEIKKNNIATLVDMIDKDLLFKKYKSDSKEKEAIEKQIEQIKSYYVNENTSYDTVLQTYFGVKTEKELKEKFKLEYKRNKAVEDFVKDSITDREIKKYYDEKISGEVKASHILISVNAKSDATDEEKQKAEEEALQKAKEVIEKLNNGEKFKDLAKEYSDDKANSASGGDLGYFGLDEMVEAFSNAVKELKKDEYTKEPVKTEYGYHIILKTGEKSKKKLKEVKKDIVEKIRTQKMSDDSTLYYKALKGFREKNKIKFNDDVLKKAYNDYINNLIDSAKKSS